MGLLTTSEVADRLGVHRSRVNVLIKEGRLPAQRFGKVLLVEEKDLKLVENRKPGRPPKQASKKKTAKKE
jgi:excisionase family DNA binding protein